MSGSAELDVAQFLLACGVAFLASVLGGLSGFGTGLILPAFLVPVTGVSSVVPVMAVAMLFNNGSRVVAFREDIHWGLARRMLLSGLPACALGSFCYTLLSAPVIAFILGIFLLVSVPLRRLLRERRFTYSTVGAWTAGAGFGFLNGGLTGMGILLIALLMAGGLAGSTLVATDAIISLVMGLLKVVMFGGLDALDGGGAVIGLAVGLCTAPGAFVARALLRRVRVEIHERFMEAVVIVGAVFVLMQGVDV